YCSCSSLCPRGSLRFRSSFPTRRSSDLLYQLALAPEDETEQLAVFAARDHRANALVIVSEAEAQSSELEAFRASWKNSGGTIAADRKSTRLNSSHVKISYAVFCLKKKNT